MSRKPKPKDWQIEKIRKKGTEKDNFIRVYRSLYESDSFRSLKPTARDFYYGLLLQCGREDSERKCKCKFPQSQYEKLGFTKSSVNRAVKQLEDAGFITVLRYHCKVPSEFRLSDEWMKNN